MEREGGGVGNLGGENWWVHSVAAARGFTKFSLLTMKRGLLEILVESE